MLPSGATLFAATGKFVHGRPRPRFRRFYAGTTLLVASFDMSCLPFLFVGVAGFIALGHGAISIFRLPAVHLFTPPPIWTVIAAVIGWSPLLHRSPCSNLQARSIAREAR
jgi:hypothetical protein